MADTGLIINNSAKISAILDKRQPAIGLRLN